MIHIDYGSSLLATGLKTDQTVFDLQPSDADPVADVAGEIRRALAKPIDSPPLRDLVRRGQHVVILGDDVTRLTPCDTNNDRFLRQIEKLIR